MLGSERLLSDYVLYRVKFSTTQFLDAKNYTG